MKRLLALVKKMIPSLVQILVVAALIATGAIAYNIGATQHPASQSPEPLVERQSNHPVDLNGDGQIFTCSMHPQIQQDEPGKCPICAMELVPIDVDGAQAHDEHPAPPSEPTALGYACAMNCVPPLEEPGKCPICGMEMQPVFEDAHDSPTTSGNPSRRLTMSAEARAMASIQTSAVSRNVPKRTLRLVGELAIDPSRRAHISADVGGRVDRLTAKYEGDQVAEGQELVQLYSPELLAVQQEFLQAKAARDRLPEATLDSIREAGARAVDAARERLRLAGLSTDQINAIAQEGQAREQVTLHAPISGTVLTRHVEEGDYVAKGARILTIADLKFLWAEMAAYESDLPWLRVGQPVVFTSEAFPSERFAGQVAWIDPMTSSRTRTTRVRLNVENSSGLLRPGMFVTARIESTLDAEAVLLVPATAPLITGERAVVYIEVPNAERPTYQGIEVVLGPRTDEGYVVHDGLSEGQRVVTNGAFQIDSALQIVAKPSMMSPTGGPAMTGHAGHGGPSSPAQHDTLPASRPVHSEHAGDLNDLVAEYLEIQQALAADDLDRARQAWLAMLQASEPGTEVHAILSKGREASAIEELRAIFLDLSTHTIDQVRQSHDAIRSPLRLVHCPMAFDFAGADWLQATEEVRNPYFGASMLTCGTVKMEWPGHD